jgi:hypothetical protein
MTTDGMHGNTSRRSALPQRRVGFWDWNVRYENPSFGMEKIRYICPWETVSLIVDGRFSARLTAVSR